MPTWIQFVTFSLWIGMMGLCCVNAPWAATAIAPTTVTAGPASFLGQAQPSGPLPTTTQPTVKSTVAVQKKSNRTSQKEETLLPKIRIEEGGDTQSKGIEIDSLKVFLRFGLFMPKKCFLKLPSVSYAQDAHILSADRDLIYSTKVDGKVGDTVSLYRTGKSYTDPETREFLGYMSFKSGEAQILEKQDTEKTNNVVLQVQHNFETIDKTTRITKEQWPPILSLHYLKPALIEKPIAGYIIDTFSPQTTLLGRNDVVVLSVGKQNGASVGSLLEIYRGKDFLDSSLLKSDKKNRPEIRVGRVLVYQVDDKLSLGLITEIYEKIRVFDKVRGEILDTNPDECEAKTLGVHIFDSTCPGDEDGSCAKNLKSRETNLGQ